MNIWAWGGALLAVCLAGHIAQAGKPPTTPADARTVSGLETGDAGQSIQPPPAGTRATTGVAFQLGGSATGGPVGFTIGSTSVILGPFFVCVVHPDPPSVRQPEGRR